MPSVAVPRVGVGDWVVYNGNERFEVLGLRMVQYPDEDAPREVLEIRRSTINSSWPGSYYARVDVSGGHLIEVSTTCPHFSGGTCAENLTETMWYRSSRIPWAYGSGFFQGMTLSPGDVFVRNLSVHQRAVTVSFEVVDFRQVNGTGLARIVATADTFSGGVPSRSLMVGQFEVSEDSPFVVSAAGSVTAPQPFVASDYTLTVDVKRTASGSGSAVVPVPPTGTSFVPPPNRVESLDSFEQPDGALPPGAEYVFPRFNASIQEFVSYALDNDLANSTNQFVWTNLLWADDDESGPAGLLGSTRRVTATVGLQLADSSVTRYEIRRTNTTPFPTGPEQVDYSHSKQDPWDRRARSRNESPAVGVPEATRFVNRTLPYAQEYIGFDWLPDGRPWRSNETTLRLVYKFSWLQSLGGDTPGAGLGVRRTVLLSAQAGLLDSVYGPHATEYGPPWAVGPLIAP